LLQHESQHSETIAFLLHLHRFNAQTPDPPKHLVTPNTTLAKSLHLPAGEFWMGSDRLEAQDNERPRHLVHLESYWIDAYPVTQGQYQVFIENGGYHQPKFWSEPGWQWRQSQAITQPLYWWEPGSRQDHPVYGVSWYEAQAYAGFVGKRLPTEAEWERAASQEDFWPKIPPLEAGCFPDSGEEGEGQLSPYLPNRWAENDLCPPDPGEAGGANPASPGRSIWEWTDSWFSPYPNFEAYPYPGYSQVYFDQQHRVLRGGSWVTRPWAHRKTFRNWYQPGVREIFVGFRCAS
jgi:ergothioneine biosynthesis protein EgtB